MKSRRTIHIATAFFLLSFLVVLLSWAGNIYAWEGVRSLMNVQGVRWFLRSVQINFVQCPVLPPAMILFFGLGLWLHSGMGNAVYRAFASNSHFSRKERYALMQSSIAGVLYVLQFCILAFGPWDIVKSALGSLYDSPLSLGVWFVISLGIGFMGFVYGFLSDNYHSDRDVVSGMMSYYMQRADFFVSLFFISQFFNILQFSGLHLFWGMSDNVLTYIYIAFCIYPLFRK